MNIQRNRRSHVNTFPRNVRPIEDDRRIDDDGLLLSPAPTRCSTVIVNDTFPRNVKPIEGDRRIDDDGLLLSPSPTCTIIGRGQKFHDGRTTRSAHSADKRLFQEIEQALLSLRV